MEQGESTTSTEGVLDPVRSLISSLETERDIARGRAAHAVASLHEFKVQVRNLVIDRIRRGIICRDGANEALEEWGLEPYSPRYRVWMTAQVSAIVESASDGSEAASWAESALQLTSNDGDVYDFSLDDVTARGAEEDED